MSHIAKGNIVLFYEITGSTTGYGFEFHLVHQIYLYIFVCDTRKCDSIL